jgi:hypothetical protein
MFVSKILMNRGWTMREYSEKEITESVLLCDAGGRLNREAVGWTRKPLHICNLSGRWPRKKKWNYWCITSDDFIFSVTLANIDYIGLAAIYIVDVASEKKYEKTIATPFGAGCNMPDQVERDISFDRKGVKFSLIHSDEKIKLRLECGNFNGESLKADVEIGKPSGHETLNVVIPWSSNLFQFTSKQNCLPTTGEVSFGDKIYRFESGGAWGCLDYGRGVWPYKIVWNWASGSGKQGEDTIGIQLGGKWTDGTGMNENGISLNGKLFKISEDVVFICDEKNYMKPWRIKTKCSDRVDLTLTPFLENVNGFNVGVLGTDSHQLFGRFSGSLGFDGKAVKIDGILGWAEQVWNKW